jgi:integrase
MFPVSKEITVIHRYIEKLPKVQRFLASKERGTISRNTSYKSALALLHQFVLIKHSNLTLETIIDSFNLKTLNVYEFLDGFVAFLQTKKLSQSSISQYLAYVKSYLQYHDVDIIPYKFKKRVILPKIPKEEAQPIDQNDIRTILLQCHNRRLKTYLLVLASSGVRVIEACSIRIRDLIFNDHPTKLHIRAQYTKTKRSRDIFLSDEAAQYLREWIEYRFGIDLEKMKNVPNQINECLVFQVHNNRRVTPRSIYIKLVQQFHEVLKSVNLDQRKDDLQRRRKITLHSFRRFVKTTISNSPAGSDYSEWILGHNKSSYYVIKPEVRAEIYSSKCDKYLTFLDYSMLKAAGKTIEAKVNEIKKEKEIESQKHEQEMKAMQEQVTSLGSQLQLVISTITKSDPAVRNKLAKQLVKSGVFKPDPQKIN